MNGRFPARAMNVFLCRIKQEKLKMKKINQYKCYILAAGLITGIAGCKNAQETMNMIPNADNFRHTVDGKNVDLYLLDNHKGMQAAVTNYGGRLVSLIVPDKNSKPLSIVAGFGGLDGYMNSTEPYFGATIGRYGNRICRGQFNLDGKSFRLSINNGANTLHGGKHGFQYKVWDAVQHGDSVLVLTRLSANGEEGFPGNLKVKVTYTLKADNSLQLDYEATTDAPTVVNLTNHAFFNLNGEGSGEVSRHRLQIFADHYTPVDTTLIPAGATAPVKGTPFDFTKAETIGARINAANEQLHFGKGYDHNYVLNNPGQWEKAAEVTGDISGIRMEIFTDQPGLQFYSGNFMQSKNRMRKAKDDFRTAFCLETQHFPDSPNQAAFPSAVLRPGENYKSRSVYRFSSDRP
jgi:aldose 1-epimerase